MPIPIPTDPEAQREMVKIAKTYCDEILMPPLGELGELFADQIRHWRLMNKVRCICNAKAYMERKGVQPTKLLPDVFIPLIEEAGNTSDPTLQDMFARLLASHMDPEEQQRVHPTFAKILGQVAPLDVIILNLIDRKEEDEYQKRKLQQEPLVNWNQDQVLDLIKTQHPALSAAQIRLSIENLRRLGLLNEEVTLLPIELPPALAASGNSAPITADVAANLQWDPTSIYGPIMTTVETHDALGGAYQTTPQTDLYLDPSSDPAFAEPTMIDPPAQVKSVVLSTFCRRLLRACNDPLTYWRAPFCEQEEVEWRQKMRLAEQTKRQNEIYRRASNIRKIRQQRAAADAVPRPEPASVAAKPATPAD